MPPQGHFPTGEAAGSVLELQFVPGHRSGGGPVRRRPSSRCDASPVHEFSRGFQAIRSPAMSSGRRLLIQRAARADRLGTGRPSTSTPLIHRLAPSCCGQVFGRLRGSVDRSRNNAAATELDRLLERVGDAGHSGRSSILGEPMYLSAPKRLCWLAGRFAPVAAAIPLPAHNTDISEEHAPRSPSSPSPSWQPVPRSWPVPFASRWPRKACR